MITKEELEGIFEIWTVVPNVRPGLKLPVRIQLTEAQVAEVKNLLRDALIAKGADQ